MKILTVNNERDKRILEKKSKAVDFEKDDVKDIVDNMKETLKESKTGIGLAANQIGVLKRIFVMDAKRSGHIKVFINPHIIAYKGGAYNSIEGCLSNPGVEVLVRRARTVYLSWTGTDGSRNSKLFHGLESKIIQHEMDHFEGKLI